eukprot:tig00000789_g4115.t1
MPSVAAQAYAECSIQTALTAAQCNDPADIKEAQLFARYYSEFQAANCEVVGITGRPLPEVAVFSSKYELPFAVLSDPQLEAAAMLKVRPTLGFFPKRVTYVIDQRARVQMCYDSPSSADQHVARALDAAQKTSVAITPVQIQSPYISEREACCGMWTFLMPRMM